MTLDALVLWIFVAGALAGVGVAIIASLIPEAWRLLRAYRRYVRRRRPPGEPKPL